MIQLALRRSSGIMSRPAARLSVGLFAAEVLALCLPALVNHGPIMFPTRAPTTSGCEPLEKARSLIEPHTGGINAASLATLLQKARGVRSAFYLLFTYLATNTVSLWLVIALQAVLVALVLRLTFDLLCPRQPRWRGTLFIMLIATARCCHGLFRWSCPDVFTPVLALCIILLMLFWRNLNRAGRRGSAQVEMALARVATVSKDRRCAWCWRRRHARGRRCRLRAVDVDATGAAVPSGTLARR